MSESSQIAAEHQDHAAHSHRTGAVHQGKEDHLTGHERSRQSLEHSNKAYLQTQQGHQENTAGHTAAGITHEVKEENVASLAYELWQSRGCPAGSPNEDWFRAVEQLRSRR
jgi:hypothetical protein